MTTSPSDEPPVGKMIVSLFVMPLLGMFSGYSLYSALIDGQIWTRGRYISAETDLLAYWGLVIALAGCTCFAFQRFMWAVRRANNPND